MPLQSTDLSFFISSEMCAAECGYSRVTSSMCLCAESWSSAQTETSHSTFDKKDKHLTWGIVGFCASIPVLYVFLVLLVILVIAFKLLRFCCMSALCFVKKNFFWVSVELCDSFFLKILCQRTDFLIFHFCHAPLMSYNIFKRKEKNWK